MLGREEAHSALLSCLPGPWNSPVKGTLWVPSCAILGGRMMQVRGNLLSSYLFFVVLTYWFIYIFLYCTAVVSWLKSRVLLGLFLFADSCPAIIILRRDEGEVSYFAISLTSPDWTFLVHSFSVLWGVPTFYHNYDYLSVPLWWHLPLCFGLPWWLRG